MKNKAPFRINTSRTIAVLLFTCLVFLPVLGHTKMRTVNKILAGTPPYEIVKRIISSNNKGLNSQHQSTKGYAPLITWLTDPDPRIQPKLILAKTAGNIYTCTNMGAQLEIAAGQVDYGIRHLHTPVLLITVNSDNQAIKFFMEGYSNLSPSIRNELDHLHLPLLKDKQKGKFTERLLTNVEANIDYQVDRAVARYRDRIDLGRLTILGSVLDLSNTYKRGKGRLIIININGERNDKKIRNSTVARAMNSQTGKLSIGRYRPVATKTKK